MQCIIFLDSPFLTCQKIVTHPQFFIAHPTCTLWTVPEPKAKFIPLSEPARSTGLIWRVSFQYIPDEAKLSISNSLRHLLCHIGWPQLPVKSEAENTIFSAEYWLSFSKEEIYHKCTTGIELSAIIQATSGEKLGLFCQDFDGAFDGVFFRRFGCKFTKVWPVLKAAGREKLDWLDSACSE